MLIKNKKIYLICLLACAVTMILGMLLSNVEAVKGLGDVLYTISMVLGVVVGSMRTYMEFLKWVFRKKEHKLVALSIIAFIFKWFFKIWFMLVAVAVGFGVCLGLPAVAGAICYLRHKDELVEA